MRTDTHRLIVHNDGDVELYNHASPEKDTLNIAPGKQELVLSMAGKIHDRAPEKLPESVMKALREKLAQAGAVGGNL